MAVFAGAGIATTLGLGGGTRMVHLTLAIRMQLIRHGLTDAPREACGIISIKGSDPAILRVTPMANLSRSRDYFQFDPGEQLRVWREIDLGGEKLYAIYHTHPNSEPVPSRTDIDLGSAYPNIHHVIVMPSRSIVRSYRFENGKSREEPVVIHTEPGR